MLSRIFDAMFQKNNEERLKRAFQKIKEDINNLQLKINAIVYEKLNLKRSLEEVQRNFAYIYDHYRDAIVKYNSLHNSHEENIKELNKRIQKITNILNKIAENIHHLDEKTNKIAQDLNSKIENINKKIEELTKKEVVPKREGEKLKIKSLSDSEKHFIQILLALKKEYNNEIPVSALIDEIYQGDRNKASTLSNYLNKLEKKGLIQRHRVGRKAYITITH